MQSLINIRKIELKSKDKKLFMTKAFFRKAKKLFMTKAFFRKAKKLFMTKAFFI
jgi:hypothetical protein